MEIIGVALVILLIFIYFLPALVANGSNHSKALSITVLNIFLGWTLLGWVIALVWAVSEENQKKENISLKDVAAQIERLHQLKDRGIITEEEFNTKKAKLLE